MNILSFFNINKMTNKFADFKNYLKLLSPEEEQLHEINYMINDFNKSNRNGGITYKYCKKIPHNKRTKNI